MKHPFDVCPIFKMLVKNAPPVSEECSSCPLTSKCPYDVVDYLVTKKFKEEYGKHDKNIT